MSNILDMQEVSSKIDLLAWASKFITMLHAMQHFPFKSPTTIPTFVLTAARISRAPNPIYLEKNGVGTSIGNLKGKLFG